MKLITNRLDQLVEHLLSSQKVASSFPGWVIPKTLKMEPFTFSLAAQHKRLKKG